MLAKTFTCADICFGSFVEFSTTILIVVVSWNGFGYWSRNDVY